MEEILSNTKTPKADKTSTQFIKFLLIGGIGTIIQLVTVNALFSLLKEWKAPLPSFLTIVFTERTLGTGNANWGYVLPFFISNLLSNTYSYIHNLKGNFKTSVPEYYFAIYIGLLAILITLATWISGVVANILISTQVNWIVNLAPTLGSITAGIIYTLILFPIEKFVLFKK